MSEMLLNTVLTHIIGALLLLIFPTIGCIVVKNCICDFVNGKTHGVFVPPRVFDNKVYIYERKIKKRTKPLPVENIRNDEFFWLDFMNDGKINNNLFNQGE